MSEIAKALESLEWEARGVCDEPFIAPGEAAAIQSLIVEMHDAHARTEADRDYWYNAWRGLALKYNDIGD